MGQSTSVENTETIHENEDHLHDSRRRRYKKIDVKSCPKNIDESQEDDVTQSPIDSFFPIINTAEAPSNCPEAMSSSIVETTNPLKDDVLKPSKNTSNTIGFASKIMPKRPWSNYQLFPLNSSASPISDSKARMIRSPRIQPKENKGGETNRNQASRGRIKFVEPVKHESAQKGSQLEELSKQNSDIDQLITMMQNHKVSDDNNNHGSLDFSRNTFVPSSEFQFSFPTTPSQYASPVISNEEEEEEEDEDYQFKYDSIKNRKILPLPKRKSKYNPATGSMSSSGSSPSVPSIPSSPFTFSSDKTMPKASFLTDASRNMLQQQKQHQTQDSNALLSEMNSIANDLVNSRKDRPSMSKKMKSVEIVQATLINDETAATSGKRKCHAVGPKTPPRTEVFTNYTPSPPPTKEDQFDFSNFNFKFGENETKSKTLKKTAKLRKNPAMPIKVADTTTHQDTNTISLPNKASFNTTYNHNGKSAKDNKKLLSAKPPAPTPTKRPPISQPTATNVTKKKGKESEKKKAVNNTNNTNKTTKKNKKSKNKKEEIAPGGFLSSNITLFENPTSDDWICFFCQFDIFCHGLEDAKKKNGYYRRKNEKLNRTNEARRIINGIDPADDPFDDEHRLHHLQA
ncbi:hypothetical protein G6F56_007579 [Rhizopus delemar]|nr:hypothetical protein G6F56_007579 [Rhizopus delemar]